MHLRATTAATTAAAAGFAILSSSSSSSMSSSCLTLKGAAYVVNPNPNYKHTRIRRRALARSPFFLEYSHLSTSSSDQTLEFAVSGQRERMRPKSEILNNNNIEDDENDVPPPISSINKGSLPISPLSQIVDNQKEFEMNLGRAVDTLRSDYPSLLTKDPSWNIYHAQLEVIDPSGVSLMGLENYKMAFSFIHAVVKWFYCEEKSALTSIRVGYDWARKCIRVSWNVELVPKMIYGGTRHTQHVDGISEYYLDRDSGLITEHKVTHLLINDQAIRPVNGIFRALAEISPIDHDPEGIPVLSSSSLTASASRRSSSSSMSSWDDLSVVKFQTWQPRFHFLHPGTSSSLFSNPNERAMHLPSDSSLTNNNHVVEHMPYDRDALQRKNASRKKFGMPPLTPEEFIKIEEEVRAMDLINKKKAAYLAEKLAQQSAAEKKKKEDSFLSNIFGGVLKNGCESNFDCERPQVCCDVGFKKICCSNGLGIVDGIPVEKYERGSLRVPLPNDNYGDEDW